MVGSLFVGICGYLWVFVVCGSRADGIVPRSMADGGGTCAGWAMFGHLHGEIGRRLCDVWAFIYAWHVIRAKLRIEICPAELSRHRETRIENEREKWKESGRR